jgi:hypothetical protein
MDTATKVLLVGGAAVVAYSVLIKPTQAVTDWAGGTTGTPATFTPAGQPTSNSALQWLNPTTYYNIGYGIGYDLGAWTRGLFT